MKQLNKTLCWLYLAAAAFAIAAPIVHAQDASVKSDYQAKLDFINDQTAAQHERDAGLATACGVMADKIMAAATKCSGDACILFLAREVGLLNCASRATPGGGTVLAQAVTAPEPPAPLPPQPTFGERVVAGFGWGIGKLVDGAFASIPALAQLKLGLEQTKNSTQLGIVQSNNALGATQSTNRAFVDMNTQTVNLGSMGLITARGIAGEGFVQIGGVAASGFGAVRDFARTPTTQITAGDGSNITIGNGNVSQSGTRNRLSSPGPCNPVATVTAPATGSDAGTTNPAPVVTLTSDCAK